MMAPTHSDDSFFCSVCGAEVAAGKTFCRECGASDEYGWNEGFEDEEDSPAGYHSEDDFDYDEYLREEFPEQSNPRSPGSLKRWFLAAVVVLTCLSLLFWSVFGR